MEVEVISKETIKPSKPTPPHLRTLRISLLDQVAPTTYLPVIFFYPLWVTDLNLEETLARLKDSLSQTLTRYYPLAGRVVGGDHMDSIDCNDEGALFLRARVDCRLSDLLNPPKIEILHKLTPPVPPLCPGGSDGPAQVAIQFNVFNCGGVAICLTTFHRIVDAVTIGSFMECWATIARGSASAGYDSVADIHPDFPGASLVPPREPLPQGFSFPVDRSLQRRGNSVVKRFTFNAAAISVLQRMATSKRTPNPTRFEAVTAFLWKHAMAACKVVHDDDSARMPSILGLVLDLRRRMVPPLSKYSVGNIAWRFCTLLDEAEAALDSRVGLIRATLGRAQNEFMPKFQGDGVYQALGNYFDELREMYSTENVIPFTVTSWLKMGYDRVDFGWGKPVWVSLVGGENRANRPTGFFLGDSGLNGDIEAWMIFCEPEMAVLERDPEFLKFASLNPSLPIPVARSTM